MKTWVGGSIILVCQATTVWAQSVPSGPAPSPPGEVSWQVAGGRDSVALRDIARTGTPVDASPVAWRGTGPSFLIQHLRSSGARLHRFSLSATRASHFVYDSGLESRARPPDDSFWRVAGHYEYRRYFFSNVVVRGFDIGAGGQAGVARRRLTRHVSGGIETGESRTSLTTAVVASARFRRGRRLGVEVNWANGGHIGRANEWHSAEPAASRSRWGGGWLTDLEAALGVALSSRANLTIRYLRSNDGLLSSHRHLAGARRSLTVGVTYAR